MYLGADSTLPTNPNPTGAPSGFDWTSLFNSFPALFGSVTSMFGKNQPPQSLYSALGPTEPKKSNTVYYIIGGVLLVTLVGTVIALNRRPKTVANSKRRNRKHVSRH